MHVLQIHPVVRDELINSKEKLENEMGLIIGMHSTTPTLLTLLHLAPTKLPNSTDSTTTPTITPSVLTHHTRQLLRMLPGGLNILGIYSTTTTPPPTQLLHSLAKNLVTKFANYFPDQSSLIYLQYDRVGGVFDCKVNSGDQWEQVKVEFGCGRILRVETDISLEGVVVQQEVGDKFEVKEGVEKVVGVWRDTLTHSSTTLFNHTHSSPTVKYVETENISLLIETLPSHLLATDKKRDFINHLELRGKMHLVGFVMDGESTERAEQSLHTDLLRSLSSRLTLHTESLIEEDDNTSSSTQQIFHEIPRRVFVELIKSSGVLLSDYLFPGEGPRDCCDSFRDIVGLTRVDEEDICEGGEGGEDLHSSTQGSIEELAESIQQKTGNSWLLWSFAIIGLVAMALGLFINARL